MCGFYAVLKGLGRAHTFFHAYGERIGIQENINFLELFGCLTAMIFADFATGNGDKDNRKAPIVVFVDNTTAENIAASLKIKLDSSMYIMAKIISCYRAAASLEGVEFIFARVPTDMNSASDECSRNESYIHKNVILPGLKSACLTGVFDF